MPSETPRVMVAMQDDATRKLLSENLQADGYDPVAASGLGHAISRLPDHVDAVIVDLSLDTLKLLDAIRAGAYPTVDSQLPVLVLTESPDRFHSIRLLDHGADDVICEPWIYPEVRARLAAVRRRAHAEHRRSVMNAGSLRVDVRTRQVWVADTEIDLPAREFELLRVLITDPDRVFTRKELLENVWGPGDWARTRTLDSHASRLRRRLNVAGERFVRNVWGVGYRLNDSGLTAV